MGRIEEKIQKEGERRQGGRKKKQNKEGGKRK